MFKVNELVQVKSMPELKGKIVKLSEHDQWVYFTNGLNALRRHQNELELQPKPARPIKFGDAILVTNPNGATSHALFVQLVDVDDDEVGVGVYYFLGEYLRPGLSCRTRPWRDLQKMPITHKDGAPIEWPLPTEVS